MTRTIRDANGREFPAYDPLIDLRKPAATQVVVKRVPEHVTITIGGTPIEEHTDLALFGAIEAIEAEILNLERITNRPIALVKLIDNKRASINHIISWMNGNRK